MKRRSLKQEATEMTIWKWTKQKTMPLRHAIVHLVAPTLWHNALSKTSSRPTITYVKQKFGNLPLKGAEVGVYKGINARNILHYLNIETLFLVDPYIAYDEIQEGFTLQDLEKAKKEAIKNCEGLRNYCFIFKPSVEAAKEIESESLDFVYIDGDHNYLAVKNDVESWFPKIKEGGVMGGHNFHSPYYGLCRAVFAFADRNNKELYGMFGDWWLVK